jgi:hypothetical protein
MAEARSRPVQRRLFIHAGGFDPVEPDRLDHRLVGGLARFAALWGIEAHASAPDLSPDGRIMRWDVEAQGPNWKTATRYIVLRWDDRIARYTRIPRWRKIVEGFSALLHFTFNGTIFRYFAANGRYGMFVLYPFLLLLAFALLGFFAGRWIGGLDFPLSPLAGLAVGVALFIAMLRWVGNYFHLYFALSDWRFAADLAQDKSPGFEECLDEFAAELLDQMRAADYDEVVLSGVSLGGVVMAEALARAIEREPGLCQRKKLVFLTIGSSILKIGLHPEAASLKKAVARVSTEPDLFWIEYQSKVDPINFFGTNPVERMGLPATGRPVVKTIRIRQTLKPEEYRYLKVNFLRLHRQFAMPNTQRYHYDFFLICFGPMSLPDRVELGEWATGAIGVDGTYRTVPPPMRRRRATMAAAE